MVIRGFIKEVGPTREWANKDGESRQSVKLTLTVPFVTKDGQERNDELMGEMSYANPEFLEGLRCYFSYHNPRKTGITMRMTP